MWIHYFLSAVLCITPGCIQVKTGYKNKKYLTIVFLCLFVFAAFRAFNIGNDTLEYYRMFNIIRYQDNIGTAISLTRYEPGFLLFYYIMGKITSNYTLVLAIVTAFYLYSTLRFYNKYSNDIPASIILYFTFALYYDVYNIQRQCLALAVFLFALDYLIERKPIQYFILVVICASFHISALILVSAYFLPRADFKRITEWVKWFAIVIAFSLLLNFVVRIFVSLLPYYADYLHSVYSQGGTRLASIIFLLIRVVILLLLVLTKGAKKYTVDFNNTKNVFIQLTLIDILFAAMSLSFNLFDRMEVFFAHAYVICISNMISELDKNNRIVTKILAIVISFTFLTVSLIYRSNWYGIFPYRFFWM